MRPAMLTVHATLADGTPMKGTCPSVPAPCPTCGAQVTTLVMSRSLDGDAAVVGLSILDAARYYVRCDLGHEHVAENVMREYGDAGAIRFRFADVR